MASNRTSLFIFDDSDWLERVTAPPRAVWTRGQQPRAHHRRGDFSAGRTD